MTKLKLSTIRIIITLILVLPMFLIFSQSHINKTIAILWCFIIFYLSTEKFFPKKKKVKQ